MKVNHFIDISSTSSPRKIMHTAEPLCRHYHGKWFKYKEIYYLIWYHRFSKQVSQVNAFKNGLIFKFLS
jgi:hypothetical protein